VVERARDRPQLRFGPGCSGLEPEQVEEVSGDTIQPRRFGERRLDQTLTIGTCDPATIVTQALVGRDPDEL
jgi:hypothetical protein